MADELGIPMTVCHSPPGTSKWNKIEHRLFSSSPAIGAPLISHQLIVQLIAGTTGPVAGLVGIRVGVVSGVFNLESSGVEASDWRLRHEQAYHEA